MREAKRFPCPVCGILSLRREPPGTYEICRTCGWEDDGLQFWDPDYRGGANDESLNEARAAWKAAPGETRGRYPR